MEKVRYMISDAADMVNVESHVLRYWEDELELAVPRNELGHRYYTKENIQEFQKIKELKEQGYQLKAIRMIVHNGPLEELPEGSAGRKREEESDGAAGDGSSHESHPWLGENAKSQVPDMPENHRGVLENTDKMSQFTDLMTQIVGKAIAANNSELSRNISEDVGEQVIKEMNYLMREREEAEEERFHRLDIAIRGSMKGKRVGKIKAERPEKMRKPLKAARPLKVKADKPVKQLKTITKSKDVKKWGKKKKEIGEPEGA